MIKLLHVIVMKSGAADALCVCAACAVVFQTITEVPAVAFCFVLFVGWFCFFFWKLDSTKTLACVFIKPEVAFADTLSKLCALQTTNPQNLPYGMLTNPHGREKGKSWLKSDWMLGCFLHSNHRCLSIHWCFATWFPSQNHFQGQLCPF